MIRNLTTSLVRRGKREKDPEVSLETRVGLMNHRLRLPDPSPQGVAEFAVRKEGRRYADYTFYLRRDGTIYQLNDVAVVTWHAKGWSAPFIGVAWEGDFRLHGELLSVERLRHPDREGAPPTPQQASAGIWLHERLCYLYNWVADHNTIVGHTSKPDATDYPEKICPGSLLQLAALRETVTRKMQIRGNKSWAAREIELRQLGFTF